MTGHPVPAPLTPGDRDLLLRLLDLPTAGPLETGPDAPPSRLAEAQDAYGRHAAAIGLRVVRHAPAEPDDLASGPVPAPVREAMACPRFLADQPSLVLRLGPDDLPAARTVMFNVHLDTVAGLQPARFDGERFHGRGAIDAKGPAVALLAGIRAACSQRPALGRDIGVLVQAVAGEEGGAMGVFGTRPLVQRGFTGRLNVFCEPTGGRFLPHSTAAMTARIVVDGEDAVDDRPGGGHNASVLLGFLAQHLGRALDPAASEAAVCVAGLHTGTRHNKVYGSGSLLLNIGYASQAAAHRLERRLREALDEGLDVFASVFAGTELFGRTAADARAITRLEWHKHGLPVLDDRDAWGHALLRDRAGIPPWPAAEPAFTCDAIWMVQVPDACTVVLGPGDLAANNAHAAGEFARADELAAFATAITRLLVAFTDALNRTDLNRTDLARTDLDRAGLGRAGLDRVGLDRVGLDRVGLDRVGLDRVGLDRVGLDRAGLDRADLGRADADCADADCADVDGAGFDRTDLDCADLGRADLGRADLAFTDERNRPP